MFDSLNTLNVPICVYFSHMTAGSFLNDKTSVLLTVKWTSSLRISKSCSDGGTNVELWSRTL